MTHRVATVSRKVEIKICRLPLRSTSWSGDVREDGRSTTDDVIARIQLTMSSPGKITDNDKRILKLFFSIIQMCRLPFLYALPVGAETFITAGSTTDDIIDHKNSRDDDTKEYS